jgi:DNA-binding response OmpR family regulator
MVNSKPQLFNNKNIQPQLAKILLIVRPSQLTNLLKLELSHEGYVLEISHDGRGGLLKWRKFQPELVIIDRLIPSISALDLCYLLRSSNNRLPILVLTNSQNIGDRVMALDAGADDCLSQPFSLTEFLAKIRAHLRRNCQNTFQASVLTFDNLSLNTLTREIYRNNIYIYLTVKEFALLEYLMTHPRQVLTRTQIIDRVWGDDYLGDSNVIEVYIRYLRLKTEQNNLKRLIHTVRGVGYVLRESSL